MGIGYLCAVIQKPDSLDFTQRKYTTRIPERHGNTLGSVKVKQNLSCVHWQVHTHTQTFFNDSGWPLSLVLSTFFFFFFPACALWPKSLFPLRQTDRRKAKGLSADAPLKTVSAAAEVPWPPEAFEVQILYQGAFETQPGRRSTFISTRHASPTAAAVVAAAATAGPQQPGMCGSIDHFRF